jgi:hypothetical protein
MLVVVEPDTVVQDLPQVVSAQLLVLVQLLVFLQQKLRHKMRKKHLCQHFQIRILYNISSFKSPFRLFCTTSLYNPYFYFAIVFNIFTN